MYLTRDTTSDNLSISICRRIIEYQPSRQSNVRIEYLRQWRERDDLNSVYTRADYLSQYVMTKHCTTFSRRCEANLSSSLFFRHFNLRNVFYDTPRIGSLFGTILDIIFNIIMIHFWSQSNSQITYNFLSLVIIIISLVIATFFECSQYVTLDPRWHLLLLLAKITYILVGPKNSESTRLFST